jgi:N-acetylmuramoyl-L-alanine amidase
MKLLKPYKIFILLLILASFLYSQNKITITFEKKNTDIEIIKRREAVFVSLNRILNLLNITYHYNSILNSILFSVDGAKIKVVKNNPFIYVNIEDDNKIHQLPLSPILYNDEIYLPVNYLNEIFNNFTKYKISIKNDNLSITIEQPKKIENIKKIYSNDKVNGTIIEIYFNKEKLLEKIYKNNDTIYLNFKNANIANEFSEKFVSNSFIKGTRLEKEKVKLSTNKTLESFNYELLEDKAILYFYGKNKKVVQKQQLDVIVIDAGHGGKDPGAIGLNGTQEKKINLAVALKLGNLIKANLKNVKVVYTRYKDEFVELDKRGEIANKSNGKLFISIHCNSTDEKPTKLNGFEVYILRPGRTKDAIAVAEKENSVIKYEKNPEKYKKLTEENYILAAMAQSSFMKYSEVFAEKLHEQFSNLKEIDSKGVKQAGFLVLIGAAMPSVLVELGFLSNPNDEAFLNSEDGQNKIAKQIYDAIFKFKKYYETE